jgi:hypothetical protein
VFEICAEPHSGQIPVGSPWNCVTIDSSAMP